jgi:hypothetical protein
VSEIKRLSKHRLRAYASRLAGAWLASDADSADCFEDLHPEDEEIVRELIRKHAEHLTGKGVLALGWRKT